MTNHATHTTPPLTTILGPIVMGAGTGGVS
jgi:hypothetical protein